MSRKPVCFTQTPRALASLCDTIRVDAVIVNGRIVVKDGALATGDERNIARRANAASAAMTQ